MQVVHNLPPEESAVAAIQRGLFYLDSRALAALLKELHKGGLSGRHAPAAPVHADQSRTQQDPPGNTGWPAARLPHRQCRPGVPAECVISTCELAETGTAHVGGESSWAGVQAASSSLHSSTQLERSVQPSRPIAPL